MEAFRKGSPALEKLFSSPTRARIFLEFWQIDRLSATQVAHSFDLPVANIHYHFRALLESGLIERVGDSEDELFTRRFYALSETLRSATTLEQLNEVLMDANDSMRRNFVTASCITLAATFSVLADTYRKLKPDEFNELFFSKANGVVGLLPVNLAKSQEFQNDLRILIGKHLKTTGISRDADGFLVFGVLPQVGYRHE